MCSASGLVCAGALMICAGWLFGSSPRFVSYFFVINPPEIKIVRLSALVAFPVARSEPIFLSFSGNSLSRFVWWRHVFTEKQKITVRSGQKPAAGSVLRWIFFFLGALGCHLPPSAVPWVFLRLGLQRFIFAPFRGSAAALAVLTGWALAS